MRINVGVYAAIELLELAKMSTLHHYKHGNILSSYVNCAIEHGSDK